MTDSPRSALPAPLYIDLPTASIFGLWHGTATSPATAAWDHQGCVICPPFGHEYVVSYRALRLLAERLSHNGMPALRFDYYGTGDAPGEVEAATLQLWVQSAILAANEVERRTRGGTVSMIGLRIGATVALASALARDDVESLVLWDPVLDGRSFLSELNRRQEAWAGAYEVDHRRAPPSGETHVLGYPMPVSLRESFEAIRCEGLERAPAPRVLIVVSRLDSRVESLAESVQDLGASVDLLIRQEAHVWNQPVDIVVTAVPNGVLREILSWLTEPSDRRTSSQAPTPTVPSGATVPIGAAEGAPRSNRSFKRNRIVEHAVTFAEPLHLVGILTRPDASEPNRTFTKSPAVILLNAGLLHRVGPKRLWVRVARRLARGGRTVFRFDFSGVGDSPPRRDRVPFRESRVLETQAAMDQVTEETGHERFVLMGLCTGADYGFQTALEDPRVVGLILLDGYPYRTLGWYVRHYGRRMLRPKSWSRLLSGKYSFGIQLIRRLKPTVAPRLGEELARQIPTRSEMAKHLRTLVNRGVHLHFLYTGGMPAWYNYAGQFEAAFGNFGDHLTVGYVREADHLFTPPVCQEELLDRMERWLDERYELGEARRPTASSAGV